MIPERRTAVVTARVSAAEFADWRAKAAAAGVPLSALIRRAMARTRTWTARAAEVERERTREVGRIGNNLNQIPRSANGTVFSRHWNDASGGTQRPVQDLVEPALQIGIRPKRYGLASTHVPARLRDVAKLLGQL